MKDSRGYQQNFSNSNTAMHDVQGRKRKAETMVAVLSDYFDVSLKKLRILDIGASTGIIDEYLSSYFYEVVGIDIDETAINKANASYSKENLRFLVGDAMAIPTSDDCFDVVICSQVYEHVPDAWVMIDEVYRVLKPGGVCYFSASNRLMWNEPHYNLPLLSVLPRWLSHLYIRFSGKADYYHELHLSYWGLKRLVRKFMIVDYTRKIVERSWEFGTSYMLDSRAAKGKAAIFFVKYFYWAMPGYIWLLKK